MAALGLCSSKAQAFSSCGEGVYSTVQGLLIEVASLVAKHRLYSVWTAVAVAFGLRICGTQA